MKKPIIGITSAYEREEELLNYHRTTVSIDYTKSIVATGGIPIVLPVTDDRTIIKAQLSLIDLIISYLWNNFKKIKKQFIPYL